MQDRIAWWRARRLESRGRFSDNAASPGSKRHDWGYKEPNPAADLKAICKKTYTPQVFGIDKIAPVRKLETGLYIQELSNGPTLAFKDIAMQLLGNLLEYEWPRRHGN